MKIHNPYIDEINDIFQQFANEDGVQILNELNAKKHWETLVKMTKRFGTSIVDLNSAFELEMFKKTGWIEFRIFADPEINAFAYAEDQMQLLEINFGTLYLIRDSFFTLFSIPEFLPQIGNSKLEKTQIEKFRENLDTNTREPNYFKYLPNCPIRQKCADEMSTTAVQFIYAHEATHLVKCHTQYESNRYGIKRYSEIKDFGKDINRAFDSRSFELQADEGGMSFSMMYFSRLLQTDSKEIFKPYSFYLIWIITIEILFKLLNPNDSYEDDQFDTHPNSFIRTMHLFELSILDAIDLGLVKDEKQAVEVFDKSFNLIEEILSKNSFLPYSSGPFKVNQNKMKEYRLNVVTVSYTHLTLPTILLV